MVKKNKIEKSLIKYIYDNYFLKVVITTGIDYKYYVLKYYEQYDKGYWSPVSNCKWGDVEKYTENRLYSNCEEIIRDLERANNEINNIKESYIYE